MHSSVLAIPPTVLYIASGQMVLTPATQKLSTGHRSDPEAELDPGLPAVPAAQMKPSLQGYLFLSASVVATEGQ